MIYYILNNTNTIIQYTTIEIKEHNSISKNWTLQKKIILWNKAIKTTISHMPNTSKKSQTKIENNAMLLLDEPNQITVHIIKTTR